MRSPGSFCPGRWPSLAPDGVAGYSPCRERSSNGAKLEPGEVIPEPQGARLPPARLLVAAAEARTGLSVLPDPPPGLCPPGGAGTAGHAGESSAAPAPPCARRPRPAVPPPPRAAPGPDGPPRRRGSHSPHLEPSYSGSSRAPPGTAPPTSPARSPGQPPLQRDAWRPTRGAIAARSWRGPGHLCAVPSAPPRTPASAGNPEAVVFLAHSRVRSPALNASGERWSSSPESS